MSILKHIFFFLLSTSLFSQTEKPKNWKASATEIVIDTHYILKEPIVLKETSFNYWHTPAGTKISEFGNIDSLNKANGDWLFLHKSGAVIMKGKAINGNKTGTWTSPPKSEFIYEWDSTNTKTQLKKNDRRHKKKKHKKKKERPIKAK